MARVIHYQRLNSVGPKDYDFDTRGMGAWGFVTEFHRFDDGNLRYEAFDEGGGLFFLSELLNVSGPAFHVAKFGVPFLLPFLRVSIPPVSVGQHEGSIAFVDEPIAPFGSMSHVSRAFAAIPAGGTFVLMALTAAPACQSMGIEVAADRAFSIVVERQANGITQGPVVVKSQTAAAGGFASVLIPAAEFNLEVRVRNDDGALAMAGTGHVRSLFGSSQGLSAL